MARAVPSHHGRFRADARSYLPAIVIVTVHSSLLLPAPLCGAALALVTVSLSGALWRRPTKAVTSLRPSKFTSDERPPGNSHVPVQGPAAMFEQNVISPAGMVCRLTSLPTDGDGPGTSAAGCARSGAPAPSRSVAGNATAAGRSTERGPRRRRRRSRSPKGASKAKVGRAASYQRPPPTPHPAPGWGGGRLLRWGVRVRV